MANKRGKTYEAPDMRDVMRRMGRAMVRRAAEGDREVLWCLRDAQSDLNQAMADAARAAHDHGLSWTDIARELGISRQAARQRFGSD